MGALISRILILALVVWLIRSVLISFQGSGKARSKKPQAEETSVMVKDPVCGMYMDTRLAIRMNIHDKQVYFCSEKCKSRYLSSSADNISNK